MASVQEILDLDIPPPTWSLRPTYATPIRSDMSYNSAATTGKPDTDHYFNPQTGLYESVGADVPRAHAERQGLLIEARQQTNYMENSYPRGWMGRNGVAGEKQDGFNGIVEDYDASLIADQGATVDGAWEYAQTFSSSREQLRVWLENTKGDDGNVMEVRVRNGGGDIAARAKYDWRDDTVVQEDFGTIELYVRKLEQTGPNNGVLLDMCLHYDPFLPGSNVSSGDSRYAVMLADPNNNGGAYYLHHANLSEGNSAQTPIVSDGGPTTSAGDRAEITDTSFRNPRVGTWYMEVFGTSHVWAGGRLLGGNDAEEILEAEYGPNGGGLYSTDDTNIVQIDNFFEPFTKHKIALSYDSASRILAGDGQTKVAGVEGRLDSSPLLIGKNKFMNAMVLSLKYYPKRLSEKQLKVLTSS